MSVVIQAENISKRYRIGGVEKKHDTFGAQMLGMLTAPFRNFSDLKKLRSFKEEDETTFWALRDINFEVKEGEVLGIIGHNGAGKSTLLKILSRITEPTTGEITIHGRVSSLLEVGTGFQPDLTGRDNIYMNGTILGMRKKEIDSKLEEIVEFSGISKHLDTPVKRYSSGMTVRLAFSVAAHLEPEILIIDEVLAVGDAEFQKKCLGKMKEVSGHGRTVLFVSHNMGAIKTLCTKGILLNKGNVLFNGPISETVNTYISAKSKSAKDGKVFQYMRSVNTGNAFYRSVKVIDETGSPKDIIYYKQQIQVRLQVENTERIKYPFIDIKVISYDGIVVSHSLLKSEEIGIQFLEPGVNTVDVQVENQLAPGEYSLTAGLHHPNGITIDYVEDVFPFTVLKAAEQEEHSYPFEWVHGYHHPKAKWQIHHEIED